MALRMIEIILPQGYKNVALELIGSKQPIDFWEEEIGDKQTRLKILLQMENTEAMMDLFDSSGELLHAEDGVIYTYTELTNLAESWYESSYEIGTHWKERHILPLAPEAATMTAVFEYKARQKSGEVWIGSHVFTGVFIKKGDAWKLIHGHESTVPSSQPE